MYQSRVFRNKKTGKLTVQIPITEFLDYEEVKHPTAKQRKKAEMNRLI